MGRRSAAAVDSLIAGLEIRDDVVVGRHGDIPVRRYAGPSAEGGPVVVWLHGGAFAHGGLDQLESHAVSAALARRGGTVIAVDYRRVPPWSPFRDAPAGTLPGTRFPVPVDDVVDAFQAVGSQHPRITLGGASAGACLAAAACLRLRDAGHPMPSQLVLAYGTFHAALPEIPVELRSRIRGLHGLAQFRPSTVRRMNHNYAGSAEAMGSAYAFPGGHDLSGLPPTLILDADRDSLRASGQAFSAELAAAGVAVRSHVVVGSTHGFLDRPGARAFDEGIGVMAEAVRSA